MCSPSQAKVHLKEIKNSTMECPICYESLTCKTTTTCCGHMFHSKCLDEWISRKSCATCPMCRTSLEVPRAYVSRCDGTTAKGFQCKRKASNGKTHCFQHGPFQTSINLTDEQVRAFLFALTILIE